ncbi:branched-chain amino acid ABC transporter permease [Nonomuraea cavernae]|uniref:Branched-chain amino acid ABC transporter permease n=1 Tax=Nonomuraea cavernae TaxID=2045107 RepID=A0A917YTL8_9ACTN|nr:branched-chain amino acid ABC transporter permease [Nonomuraea cavernae]MCA2185502.1 branched-chain amino acid ABC transporter permease [Nonomuraea cavernae]GGO66665.1 branched-chain amino acid ABC transporter permease [Nonomuraea cavernae]
MHILDLLVSGLTLGSIYALVALGFHLVFKMTGIIDFAQGDKVVIGGLLGLTLVQQGLSTVMVVLLLVVVAGLLLGIAYDAIVILPTQRNGALAAMAATVGMTLVLAHGHHLVWGPDPKPFPPVFAGGIELGPLRVSFQSMVIWAVVVAVGVGLALLMGRSRTGRGMVAAATDPLAATAVGVNVSRMRALSFALAFGLAALAGVLVAPITLAGGSIGTALTIKGFTGAVLGGLNSTKGVVLGALLLGVVESQLAAVLPNGNVDPVVFVALVIILLLMPNGLFGLRRQRLA